LIGCGEAEESFRNQHILGAILPSLDDLVLKQTLLTASYGQRQMILLARDWLVEHNKKRAALALPCPPVDQPGPARPNLPSPLRSTVAALKDVGHVAFDLVENVTAEQIMLWRPLVYVFGFLFTGGLAVILLLQASPWFLLWLGPALFAFLLMLVQNVTSH
jgi:hypothetical protein